MPAKRPRIMFTPSDRAYSAIRRVAAVTQRPVASVVTEQVEVLAEHLENLATVLEHADRLRKEEPQAFAAAAKAAFEQMLPLVEQADLHAGKLEEAFRAFPGQLGMFDDSEPPSSNTGATGPREDS